LRIQGVIKYFIIKRARNNKFGFTIATLKEVFTKGEVFVQVVDAIGAKCCFSAKLAVAGNLCLWEDFCTALASNAGSIPML
jgi:hypothetical protein